jgi:hypothetical protein
MKIRFGLKLSVIVIIMAIAVKAGGFLNASADPVDEWWNDAWPYRVLVTVNATGVVGVNLDFSSLFSQAGLSGALLDVRSIRVVPYTTGEAGEPIPYEETYSTLIIAGDTLNKSSASPESYWYSDYQTALSVDQLQYTQGSGAIKAEIVVQENFDSEPDFTYFFNGYGVSDWTAYESLIYDILPEVNESAIDQTPDLFQLELLGLGECPMKKVNGPALSLSQWNQASTSLVPFGNCTTPNFSSLSGLRFFLKTNVLGNNPGAFEDGDEVTLWLDNVRLVDQDGAGEIRWTAEEDVDRYYVYFDTFNHAGHPEPSLTTIGEVSPDSTTPGTVESGGYFHQVTGASLPENLAVWNAPPVEKILKNQPLPVIEKPLLIHAARGEFEPIQLIIQSETQQNLAVNVSDLVMGKAIIPATQIQLFRVDYISVAQLSDFYGRITDWPDPLYPITLGEEINFPAGENQPLWFRIEVPAGTPAGKYSGTITIGTATIPFSMEVWNFFLPQTIYLDTEVGFDWDTVMETYHGTDGGVQQPCYGQLEETIYETLADYHLTPSPPGDSVDNALLFTLTAYEVEKAHDHQILTGEPVWWEFTSWDHPPLPNPAVIDRPGVDARVLPWMAWLDRVDGLHYAQSADWTPDPWITSFSNDLGNGDGFLFYPPNDATIGSDPCVSDSNRLAPSIRLELLREGLEDYAYLWLLNGRKAEINLENQSDLQARSFIGSRTDFMRSPMAIKAARMAIAELLQGKQGAYYLPLIIH